MAILSRKMINSRKLLLIIVIESLILAVISLIISNYFVFETFMEAGSYGIFVPLPIYEKVYANSQFIREGFNFINLLIDIFIVLSIALAFSWSRER